MLSPSISKYYEAAGLGRWSVKRNVGNANTRGAPSYLTPKEPEMSLYLEDNEENE